LMIMVSRLPQRFDSHNSTSSSLPCTHLLPNQARISGRTNPGRMGLSSSEASLLLIRPIVCLNCFPSQYRNR
jgi:hypothetical protein